MKSEELEVLVRNGRECSNEMINSDPGTESYRTAKAKFNLVLKIMDELAKVGKEKK